MITMIRSGLGCLHKPVSFQVESVLYHSLMWSEAGWSVLEY